MHPAYEIFGETASQEEVLSLKEAFKNGAVIEAKGRDTVDTSYNWAVTQTPRWDFKNNYYRVKA